MKAKTKLMIICIISVIAIINAFYLSYDWIFDIEQSTNNFIFPISNVSGSETAAWAKFCDINETLSCTTVLQNPLSQIYGVPFPAIALFVYPVIFLVSLFWLWWVMKNHFKILAAMWLGWISFNGYFIYQETFNIWAFCPLCVICSAIIITIFTLSILEVRKECTMKQ